MPKLRTMWIWSLMMAAWISKNRQDLLNVLILALLPWLICLISDNWIFNPVNNLQGNSADPWIYNGLFTRYRDQLFPTDVPALFYFVERVGLIAPGKLLYWFLPPVAANYALHMLIYYTGVFSLYILIQALFNRSTAFWVSAILGTYVWYLTAVGTDYVDGLTTALQLLIFCSIYLAVSRKRSLWFMIAGAAVAASISANISQVFILAINMLLLRWLFTAFEPQAKLVLNGMAFFVIGVISTAILLAAFYYSFSGTWNFLSYSIDSIPLLREYFQNPQVQQAHQETYSRFPPNWHLLPVGSTLVSIIILTFRSNNLSPRNRTLMLTCCSIIILIYVSWFIQQNYGAPYLIMYMYMSSLIPTTFVLLSCIIYCAWGTITTESVQSSVLIIGLLLLPLIAITIQRDLLRLSESNVLLYIVLSVSFITLLFRRPWGRWILGLGISILGVIGAPSMPLLGERGVNRTHFELLQAEMAVINNVAPDTDSLNSLWLWQAPRDGTFPHLAFAFGFRRNNVARIVDGRSGPLADGRRFVTALPPGYSQENLETDLMSQGNQIEILENYELINGYRMIYGQAEYTIGFELGKPYEAMSDQNTYVIERDGERTLVWTGPGETSLYHIGFPATGNPVALEICVPGILTTDYQNTVRITLDDVQLPLTFDSSEVCTNLFRAIIPDNFSRLPERHVLTLVAPTVPSPNIYDDRELGLRIDYLQVVPAMP